MTSIFDIEIYDLDPPDFWGHKGLMSVMDGVRCGPQHVCMNQSCVGVASYPVKCRHCPGKMGGCDQHHECYCDEMLYGREFCSYGTYEPINPGEV